MFSFGNNKIPFFVFTNIEFFIPLLITNLFSEFTILVLYSSLLDINGIKLSIVPMSFHFPSYISKQIEFVFSKISYSKLVIFILE